jgi:hypothetical protein
VGPVLTRHELFLNGGRTRFQRDLDFPDRGPQVSAAMEAQSAEGIASLGRLTEREIPTPF